MGGRRPLVHAVVTLVSTPAGAVSGWPSPKSRYGVPLPQYGVHRALYLTSLALGWHSDPYSYAFYFVPYAGFHHANATWPIHRHDHEQQQRGAECS